MANHPKARLTLIGIFLVAFVLAGLAFWRTDSHTAWAGGSFPTEEIDGELFYFVRSGDTAAALADAFGVSVPELLAANGMEDAAELRLGQRLRVPANSDLYLEPADAEMLEEDAQEATPAESEEAEEPEEENVQDPDMAASPAPSAEVAEIYVVRRGDSLQIIERITGVSAEDIMAYNNLDRVWPLYRGQELRLTPPPGGAEDGVARQAAPAPELQPQQYTVVRGDSLQNLARQFDVTVDALVAANNLDSRAYLYQGQTLTIPVSGSAAADAEPTDDAADEAAADEAADEVEAEVEATMSDDDAMDADMTDADTDGQDTGQQDTDQQDTDDDDEARDSPTKGGESEADTEQAAELSDAEVSDAEMSDDAGASTDEDMPDDESMDDATSEEDADEEVATEKDATEEDATEEDATDEDAQSHMRHPATTVPALWQDLSGWAGVHDNRIHVFSPSAGGAYHSQLEVIGLSQTFEGNVQMRLVDGDGEILAERYATGGSVDGYDFFRTGLRFIVPEPTEATLIVYEESMQDGSMQEEVEIEVTLLPGQRFIDIQQPKVGATVCETVLLAGYSNTFEGNVSLEISEPDGEMVALGFAIGGTFGVYREFFHSFDYSNDSPLPLLITAYELDAAGIHDRVDAITVPVSYYPDDAPECA